MFNTNTYRAGDTNLKINACSGGIYKTYKESWFKRFHLTSNLAKTLFRKENCFYNSRTDDYSVNKYDLKNSYYDDEENIEEVVILQMIICGDMEVIAEIIYKEDFERELNQITNEEVKDEQSR